MTGYNTVLKVRKFEERIAKMGMKMGHPKHSYNNDYGTTIALTPLGDSYPIYCRDAELFIGTIEDATEWLNGIEWAKNYFYMLSIVNDKKIAAKEDQERQRQLIEKIKKQPEIAKNE